MTTETRTCHECHSPQIVRNGKNRVGNQRYKCKNCGVARVLDSRWPTRQLDPTALARSYQERPSLPATGRIFGISHVTVLHHLKKSAHSPELQNDGGACASRRRAGSR